MKYIKWVVLSALLLVGTKGQSWQQGGYGWSCFHNGTYYATVGANMACPNPDSASAMNTGYLAKHDPNDHNCVITRVANSNH